ncbi:MAG: hypothetical protein HRT43_04600 [Campylobacteraceae bacterium]|nr:hypothetical protein [Campylobacteraceae bacterium]
MKFFLVLLLFISSLNAKETIRWMIWDLPPNFIIDGEHKGLGYHRVRLKMLQNQLREYDHEEQVMNFNRVKVIYDNKDDSQVIYCANDFITHPFWDIDDYLSGATFPFKAYYLVTSKSKAHLFGKVGETLSLTKIIENTNLRLVMSKNRPYLAAGTVVKKYLDKNPNATHITKLSTQNVGKSMFGSIFKDRADYTFEYINKVSFYGKELNVLDDAVIFPMKESSEVYYGYVSCVKTAKGKKVIEKINKAIRILKYTDKWTNAFIYWLPNQELIDDYLYYYNEVFLPAGDIYDDNPRSR